MQAIYTCSCGLSREKEIKYLFEYNEKTGASAECTHREYMQNKMHKRCKSCIAMFKQD
jgi:hypothetical protein